MLQRGRRCREKENTVQAIIYHTRYRSASIYLKLHPALPRPTSSRHRRGAPGQNNGVSISRHARTCKPLRLARSRQKQGACLRQKDDSNLRVSELAFKLQASSLVGKPMIHPYRCTARAVRVGSQSQAWSISIAVYLCESHQSRL